MSEMLLDFLLGFFSASFFLTLFFFYLYRKKELDYESLYEKALLLKNRAFELELKNSSLQESFERLSDLKREFQTISNEILLQNSKRSAEDIENRIRPLYQNLEEFNNQIRSFYIDESKERFALKREIELLKDLNLHISNEAKTLSNALRDNNKVSGDWGEVILERVLESSGLKEGMEYHKQFSLHNRDGKLFRPDVVVHLPRKRDIVIDSKISLKSYVAYHEERKKEFLNEFHTSIKRHIDRLSKKSYHTLDGINSLDFVVLFIPIEGAFALLSQKVPEIFEYAYKKDIILSSPSTLITILRVIENGWRVEYQDKNAKLIAKKAQLLYEKFNLFIREMHNIDKALKSAKESYDLAYKRLSMGRGNLIDKANELQSLQRDSYERLESSELTF